MSKKSADLIMFRMFFMVTKLLESKNGLTIKELSDLWVHDTHSDELPISWDIFNADREKAGILFGISIDKHSYFEGGDRYYITNPQVVASKENLVFALNAARMKDLQTLFSLDGIRLDISHFIDDVEKVLFFGNALKKNKRVKFLYQKFTDSPIRDVEIEPYWFKEYEDRMYLVGHYPNSEDRKKVYTFPLDRITNYELVPNTRSFRVPNGMNPISHYWDICGVFIPKNVDPIHIRIRAYDDEPSYLLTRKIHRSQELIGTWTKGDPFADFDLFLIPNKEFTKKIIERAGRIVVLSPENVKAEILEIVEQAASRFRGA